MISISWQVKGVWLLEIHYDINYEAMKRANEIAEEKLEIFIRAIISLQEETKESENRQHASVSDEVTH